MAIALVPAALFGLLIGSFLNVVAWRLPRGENLVTPRSHCPGCQATVQWYDNIPVFSWLALRARCRGCGERISARYPLVELTTAALYAAVVAVKHDDALQLVLGLVLVTVLVPVALIDLDHKRIPNKITGPAAIAAVGIGLALDPSSVPEQLLSCLIAGGLFFLAAAAKPGGMGMGDVKLVGVMGLYLGRAVAPAVLIGLVLGVVVGAAIVARVGMYAGRRTAVPFGPFLALGGIVAVFAGDALVDVYADRL